MRVGAHDRPRDRSRAAARATARADAVHLPHRTIARIDEGSVAYRGAPSRSQNGDDDAVDDAARSSSADGAADAADATQRRGAPPPCVASPRDNGGATAARSRGAWGRQRGRIAAGDSSAQGSEHDDATAANETSAAREQLRAVRVTAVRSVRPIDDAASRVVEVSKLQRSRHAHGFHSLYNLLWHRLLYCTISSLRN